MYANLRSATAVPRGRGGAGLAAAEHLLLARDLAAVRDAEARLERAGEVHDERELLVGHALRVGEPLLHAEHVEAPLLREVHRGGGEVAAAPAGAGRLSRR